MDGKMTNISKFRRFSETPSYEKSVVTFYVMTALKHDELFRIGLNGFISAYFDDGAEHNINEKLLLLGMTAACPVLKARRGASVEEKAVEFYKWIETDDAIDYFKERLASVDDSISNYEFGGRADLSELFWCRSNLSALLDDLTALKEEKYPPPPRPIERIEADRHFSSVQTKSGFTPLFQ